MEFIQLILTLSCDQEIHTSNFNSTDQEIHTSNFNNEYLSKNTYI